MTTKKATKKATKKTAKKTATPHLSLSPRVELPGSHRPPFVQTTEEKPAPSSTRFTVSVVVRRKTPLKAANRSGRERLTRAQYRKLHASDPAADKLIRVFAKDFGLTVAPDTPGPERRTIKLSGTVAAMQKAFGVTLLHKVHEGVTYRVREGNITLPRELVGPIEAVLGLDNRPQAQPHFRIAGEQGDLSAKIAQGTGFAKPHASGANTSYTPVQVGQLYQFPAGASATGQTIGIIELGGGYKPADLATYFKSLNQKAPKISAVLVDGGKNAPTNANSADGEVMLDIEVAASVAPGATLAATSMSSITSLSALAGLDGAFLPLSMLTALIDGADRPSDLK
jgi:kumamolisin